jgi:hypothetical protein
MVVQIWRLNVYGVRYVLIVIMAFCLKRFATCMLPSRDVYAVAYKSHCCTAATAFIALASQHVSCIAAVCVTLGLSNVPI